MTLGEHIKIARLQKKMSQQELGKAADIHQKNISKYESDEVVPSALTLKAIADVLQVSTDYLLGSKEPTAIKDTALLKLLKDMDNLNEPEKNSLMTVISGFLRDCKTKKAYSK